MVNLGPAYWPVPVGAIIRHQSWNDDTSSYIECLHYDTSGRGRFRHCSSYRGTEEYWYTESSFAPISSWYFVDLGTGQKPERKKSGFGKFISRIEDAR